MSKTSVPLGGRQSDTTYMREVRDFARGMDAAHPTIDIIAGALEMHGVPISLSEKILMHLTKVRFKPDSLIDAAEAALAESLSHAFVFKPIATGAPVAPQKAMMFVGPHGAGKTAAIAKFATELTMHKKRVVIISTDNERMGATVMTDWRLCRIAGDALQAFAARDTAR